LNILIILEVQYSSYRLLWLLYAPAALTFQKLALYPRSGGTLLCAYSHKQR